MTDNEGKTGREAIEDRLGRKLALDDSVHTSLQYLINGNLTRAQIETISKAIAGQRAHRALRDRRRPVLGRPQRHRGEGAAGPGPAQAPGRAKMNLDVSDEELMAISRKGTLALTLDEMKLIRDYFKRPKVLAERKKIGLGPNPTDVELETLAQTWSEHCKHKIFNADIDYVEDGKHAASRQPFQDLHPRLHGRDREESRLAGLGVQGQRRRHQVRQRLQHRHQGRDAQQPVRAGPLWRRDHGHRRRRPRPGGHRHGLEADRPHERPVLRLALLQRPAAAAHLPPAPDHGRRGPRHQGRRQQERHSHHQRRGPVRRPLHGQAAGLLRLHRPDAGEGQRPAVAG